MLLLIYLFEISKIVQNLTKNVISQNLYLFEINYEEIDDKILIT